MNEHTLFGCEDDLKTLHYISQFQMKMNLPSFYPDPHITTLEELSGLLLYGVGLWTTIDVVFGRFVDGGYIDESKWLDITMDEFYALSEEEDPMFYQRFRAAVGLSNAIRGIDTILGKYHLKEIENFEE